MPTAMSRGSVDSVTQAGKTESIPCKPGRSVTDHSSMAVGPSTSSVDGPRHDRGTKIVDSKMNALFPSSSPPFLPLLLLLLLLLLAFVGVGVTAGREDAPAIAGVPDGRGSSGDGGGSDNVRYLTILNANSPFRSAYMAP